MRTGSRTAGRPLSSISPPIFIAASREVVMFDPDRFIEECRAAVTADPTHKSVREVVLRAVSEPLSVLKALGEPRRAGVEPLYRSPELTILNVVWGPLMTVGPHEHRMWAVIGVYGGREDNVFWRRIDGAA